MLAGLLLVSSAPAGSAQVYNSADFVRSLYQRYLHREPSSNELTQWVWAFQKGTTLTDAQVTFLSSEDYFVRQGRNPNSVRHQPVRGSAQPCSVPGGSDRVGDQSQQRTRAIARSWCAIS